MSNKKQFEVYVYNQKESPFGVDADFYSYHNDGSLSFYAIAEDSDREVARFANGAWSNAVEVKRS